MAKIPTSRIARIGQAWARFGRGLWDAVASTVSWGGTTGTYAVLDPRRKIMPQGWQQFLMRNYSANELSQLSLPQLRALCRKMERDNCTARAIVEGLVAQTVGSGIALEPDTGDANADARIRSVWIDYIQGCDVTGKRSIYALQGQAVREWAIAGAHLWRVCVLPERAKLGLVPLCLLPLSTEWLAQGLPEASDKDLTRVPGIDLDAYGRPVVYHLVNPEMAAMHDPEVVPADLIIHGYEHRRALQNQGEPILAPTIERLFQEGDLVDAELRSAVTCAAMAFVVTSTNDPALDDGTSATSTGQGTSTDPAASVGIGATARLFPGETIEAFSHNRPGQQIAEFRRTLRGDQAGACRVSQRWLDRDYSRANYSSMRADNVDSDRLLSPLTEEIGHATIGALYLKALPYLCAIAGVAVPKRKHYRLIPDGQAYVDPLKDVTAARESVNANLSTREYEIGKRGGDWRKVGAQRALETQAEDAAVVARIAAINADIQKAKQADPSLELTWAQVTTASGAASAPGSYLAAVAANTAAEGNADAGDAKKEAA